MQRALELAHAARSVAEVPVGAVIVAQGKLLAEAHNLTKLWSDPTAHAEQLALRKALRRTGGSRLLDATMYVTLEPCAMCAGALVLSKIRRVVYAAADPKTGMCGSLGCIVQDPRLNHHVQLTAGILAPSAAGMLRAFFRERR